MLAKHKRVEQTESKESWSFRRQLPLLQEGGPPGKLGPVNCQSCCQRLGKAVPQTGHTRESSVSIRSRKSPEGAAALLILEVELALAALLLFIPCVWVSSGVPEVLFWCLMHLCYTCALPSPAAVRAAQVPTITSWHGPSFDSKVSVASGEWRSLRVGSSVLNTLR